MSERSLPSDQSNRMGPPTIDTTAAKIQDISACMRLKHSPNPKALSSSKRQQLAFIQISGVRLGRKQVRPKGGIVGCQDKKKTHSHDGERMGQMRCILNHVFPLMQSLKNQLQLAVVQIEHRLFKVSHSSMNQLCALARCLSAKILPLKHCCPQPSALHNTCFLFENHEIRSGESNSTPESSPCRLGV